MQIPALSPTPRATLHYTMRAQGGGTRTADMQAFVAPGAPVTSMTGSYRDAVLAARTLAATPVLDGMHRQPVNQAQGVFEAAEGAWLIAPLSADHRGAIGPVFVDGEFYRRAGLALWAERISGTDGPRLHAIVGAHTFADLRSSRPATGFEAIERLASEPA